MKLKSVLCYFLIFLFFDSCSLNNRPRINLPCIDIKKNYPEKVIKLTDIADVSYLHLNTENDDYLFRGKISYVTENTIIIYDNSSGSILFFSKEGNTKSRFNRLGKGPEEYLTNMNATILYDESVDEVYVVNREVIQVYSSTGEHKRKLSLPKRTRAHPIVDFDEQSLFIYDMQRDFYRLRVATQEIDFARPSSDSSYFRISKIDGKVLEYIKVPNNDIDLSDMGGGGRIGVTFFSRIVKCNAGLLLCNPETDTVFLYNKDESLIPVFCKTPLISRLDDPKVILDYYVDVGKYQFFSINTLIHIEDPRLHSIPPTTYYLRDKQTGEIFRQKISLSEYKEKELIISELNIHSDGKETLALIELDLIELKDANREKKLSGKLKELVAKLNEYKDNNVFILARFN